MTWLERLGRWLRRAQPPSLEPDEESGEPPADPEVTDEVFLAGDGQAQRMAGEAEAPIEHGTGEGNTQRDWLAGPSYFPAERRETMDGYKTNDEHLWDHLARVDQLVRAQTVRWHRTIAEHKPGHLWGMIHVTDAEVHRYLDSDFVDPESLPPMALCSGGCQRCAERVLPRGPERVHG